MLWTHICYLLSSLVRKRWGIWLIILWLVSLQRIAWTVAALVIFINGYLLLNFFLSEVDGLLVGFFVCAGTVAYVVFILYLILHRGGELPNRLNHLLSKGYSCTENWTDYFLFWLRNSGWCLINWRIILPLRPLALVASVYLW